jgi:hypothetical protein
MSLSFCEARLQKLVSAEFAGEQIVPSTRLCSQRRRPVVSPPARAADAHIPRPLSGPPGASGRRAASRIHPTESGPLGHAAAWAGSAAPAKVQGGRSQSRRWAARPSASKRSIRPPGPRPHAAAVEEKEDRPAATSHWCVCACVRACVRVCVHVSARVCFCVCARQDFAVWQRHGQTMHGLPYMVKPCMACHTWSNHAWPAIHGKDSGEEHCG